MERRNEKAKKRNDGNFLVLRRKTGGYGEYFGHGLGHSVGLEIHERPALSARDKTVLLPGMIETVEPGIYIPGFGGVRIEDMVTLTQSGIRNLTSSPKELIEL